MKDSRKYLLWALATFIVAGIVESPKDGSYTNVEFAHTVLFTILIYAWCKSHALEHGIESIGGMKVFAAVLPPIGVPVYFFKYFGFKAGVILTLQAFGYLVLLFLAYAAPYVLLQYASV